MVTSASVACGVHAGDIDTMRRTAGGGGSARCGRRGASLVPRPAGIRPPPHGPVPGPGHRRGPDAVGCARHRGAPARSDGPLREAPRRALSPYGRRRDDCAERSSPRLADAGGLVLLAPAGSGVRRRGRVDGGARRHRGLRRSRLSNPTGASWTAPFPAPCSSIPPRWHAVRWTSPCDGQVTALDGSRFDISASSICVHGDTPGAEYLARHVRSRARGRRGDARALRGVSGCR